MHLTNHASERIKERVGIPKRSQLAVIDRAFAEGIKHSETKGSLHRYLDRLYLQERTANNLRVYNYNVYLFRDDVLITVIPLNQKHYSACDKFKRKKGN